MSADNEDFDKLSKLLKLKRFEKPPPGYFNHFSNIVINRIERESELEGSWAEIPWLRKMFRMMETSPMFSGLFGATLCGLVIFGITAASNADKVPISALSPIASMANTTEKDAGLVSFNGGGSSQTFASSTDPMLGSNIVGHGFGGESTLPLGAEAVSFTERR
jgi:hypothetical protein